MAAGNTIKIFSGTSHPKMSAAIAKHLGMRVGRMECKRFPDGEIRIHIEENVRGADVCIVQPVCPPQVNEYLMELLIMLDAFRRASVKSITAVIPYYGYARQDRKDMPRVPITAKLVADLLATAGANRVLTVDLHADQIQGFFNIPLDHLYGSPILVQAIKKIKPKLERPVIVAPDVGSIKTARATAKRLGAQLAIIDKRRPRPSVAEVMHLIGEVKGCDAILIDDMVDTAGTIVQAAKAVAEHGARRVFAAATHAILSGPAMDNLEGSPIRKFFVTDTVPLNSRAAKSGLFGVVSVAPLLAEAIRRIHTGKSVSKLFS